jgi:nucleoside-diphosphate-sugar epimerase
MKILLTGATGFLGEYLLSELLDRGHCVRALYRNEYKKLDTLRFLGGMGLPRRADDLQWFKAEILDLDEKWEDLCREHPDLEDMDQLLHCAASTRFHMDEHGEPLRTNLGGARTLLRIVEKRPLQAHIISTAYVCGLTQGFTMQEVNHPRGDFVNVYEESKWEAEQLWMGKATILRPSVIVGHSETGRCISFTGWYILFQAAHLMARLMRNGTSDSRLNLQIDLPADPDAVTNIIPVDYVAKAAVALIENPANHNKIFHLTHPDPPTHQWTLDYICKKFDIGGFRFVGAGAPIAQPKNRVERMMWRQIQSIRFHFANNPLFDRSNIDAALPDLFVPPITEAFVTQLLEYAIMRDWGQAIN